MKLGLIIALSIVAAVIAAIIAAAHIFIKKRGKAQGIETKLGIDWNYIYKSHGFGNIRLRNLMHEIKYGMQRFVRGYDDAMFSSFSDYLDLLIIEDLRYMIKSRRGSPNIDSEGNLKEFKIDEPAPSDTELDERQERFTAALEEMLGHFENSRDEKIPRKKKSWHRQQALEMLVKYYNSLWD